MSFIMIKRYYEIDKLIKQGKAVVIYGPRRVGKTTLLENFLKETSLKYLSLSGDNIRVQEVLSSRDFRRISDLVQGYELLAINESQSVPNIGTALKIIVDMRKDLYVIATGSSSFELAQEIGEPLTGRKNTIVLYPFAQKELTALYNMYEIKERLDDFLIFGSYPEVITANTNQEKIKILTELVDSYLLKDILTLERIKSPKTLLNMLKLLAFQVGSLVSMNELAGQLSVDIKTVGRYLDLLEKGFVLKAVQGFSRNPRKEISKKMKYYFLDNGIRNALIMQFNSLENRNDIGALWENFVFAERMKKRAYDGIYGYTYFWRTFSGKEIDIVEERDGQLYGYEIKWTEAKRRTPVDWTSIYENATYEVINRDNYLDFIL